MKLSHVWFDVDNTLYRLVGTELEVLIFHEMYKAVLERKDLLNSQAKSSLAQLQRSGMAPHDAVEKFYDELYYGDESKGIEGLDSHSRVFKSLGLERQIANDAYNNPKIPEYVERAPPLIDLFAHFKKIDMPYSLYSNNRASTVDVVLERLGLVPKEFKFRIYGDSYPKGLGDEGFDAIIARSNVAPANILFVGDRPSIELKPAKDKGMKTALVTWPKSDESDRSRIPYMKKTFADYVLNNGPYGIKEIVDSLLRPEQNRDR